MFATPDFLTKPILEGDAALLRPFETTDIQTMESILTEPEVIRLTGSAATTAETKKTLSAKEREQIREFYRTRNEQKERMDLAVICKENQSCVGEIVLNEWDHETNSCNLRILIGQAGQGKGVGSEAIRLLVAYAFEQLHLHRIELEVYQFNPRARHVYEKTGFRLEGVKREAFRFDEEWIDIYCMAMLDSDYYSQN